jgi:GTP-dependent phosphoenolpyruvate carboxykinase
VSADLDDAEEFLAQFGDRLPPEILSELRATRERLAS